jgi:hypothetical protein
MKIPLIESRHSIAVFSYQHSSRPEEEVLALAKRDRIDRMDRRQTEASARVRWIRRTFEVRRVLDGSVSLFTREKIENVYEVGFIY